MLIQHYIGLCFVWHKRRNSLKLMRIHDKPRMFDEFVLEGAAAGIGGLGDPVYEGAVSLGRSINGLDELRAHIRRGSNPRAAFK